MWLRMAFKSESAFITPGEHAAQSAATNNDRKMVNCLAGEIAIYELCLRTLQTPHDSFRAFWANAINHFQTPALGEFSQVCKRRNLEFLVKHSRGFRADTGQFQEVEHGSRRLGS